MNEWIRACGSSSCVEVKFPGAFDESWVVVRSSDHPADFVSFSNEEWDTFVAAVKRGEFDREGL